MTNELHRLPVDKILNLVRIFKKGKEIKSEEQEKKNIAIRRQGWKRRFYGCIYTIFPLRLNKQFQEEEEEEKKRKSR